MEVLYSNCDRLRTSQGFANVLAFRRIFYGSDFARDDFQYFNSREEWDDFYDEKEAILGSEEKEGAVEHREKKKQKDATKGKKKTKSAKQLKEEKNRRKGVTEDYFRDMAIYGTSNIKHSTSLFDQYWERSTSEFWEKTKMVPWEEMIHRSFMTAQLLGVSQTLED